MTSFTRPRPLAARAALLLAALALAAAALAAPPAVMAAYDSAPEEAAAAQPAAQEGDDGPEANLPYLFAVFIVTWGLFFAYTAYMSLRRRAMEREIAALQSAMEERDEPPGEGRD